MLDRKLQDLSYVFNVMDDCVYVLRGDYVIEFMNESMIRDFGDGSGSLCYKALNGLDEVCPWCKAKRVFKGETARWEHYNSRTRKTYELLEMPLKKEDGTTSKLSILRDITRRKKREELIKTSEEQYRSLFEHVRSGVYISTKEGKFLDANRALLDMLGYESKEEFLNIDILRDLYVRPEERLKFQQMVESEGHVIDYEITFKRKDGRPIPVLLTAHVRYDPYGKVLGYEGIMADQTQRKQMESDLKKTKEFLNNVINSSVNPILVSDMNGVVILMNESAKKLGGYPEYVGVEKIYIMNIFPPGDATSLLGKIRSPEYGGVGKLEPTRVNILTASGEEIPMEMTASLLYEDGREVATMALFQDLRPKMEAERRLEKARMQLVQSDKLASIGRLAAGVAHELNNPLGGIMMYAHLVLEGLEKDTILQKNMEKIVAQADRCRRVVGELLDFARPGEPQIEQVDINKLITTTFSLIESQSLFHNILIVKQLDPSIPMIKADRSQLQQVFLNLSLNAAEAMENKGRLEVTTTSGEFVEIRFADDGRGIPSEDMDRIFEPFFTTKSGKAGTGLGLSISHGIVTRHKGTISVESKPGRGTTFIIRLPIDAPEEEA